MKTVSILGNGQSRRNNRPLDYEGDIWVCNYAFMEFALLPPIHTIGTVHREVAAMALATRKWFAKENGYIHVKKWRVLYPGYKPGIEGAVKFNGKKPISTGPMLIYQAIIEEYQAINLYGFDFEGGDLYGGYWADGSQKICTSADWWKEQICDIIGKLKPEGSIIRHEDNLWSADLREWLK